MEELRKVIHTVQDLLDIVQVQMAVGRDVKMSKKVSRGLSFHLCRFVVEVHRSLLLPLQKKCETCGILHYEISIEATTNIMMNIAINIAVSTILQC